MPKARTIDLRLLTYFQAAAETGNITQAAAQLNVAQPTLSKALQLLERQLGARVLERSPQGVRVTAIGAALLRHSQLVQAQVSDALAEVEVLRTGDAGTVRIGAGPSWVRRFLPEAIGQALTERPGLEVSVLSGFDEALLRELEAGALDFVVAERPLTGGTESHRYEFLTRDALIVCARPDHPLAGKPLVTLEEALESVWALPPSHSLARRKLDGKLVNFGVSPPKAITTSGSLSFLLNLALRHDALIYTTRSMLRTPEGQGLVELALPQLVTNREAGLIFRSSSLMTPAAEFVIARLRAICAADPVN